MRQNLKRPSILEKATRGNITFYGFASEKIIPEYAINKTNVLGAIEKFNFGLDMMSHKKLLLYFNITIR